MNSTTPTAHASDTPTAHASDSQRRPTPEVIRKDVLRVPLEMPALRALCGPLALDFDEVHVSAGPVVRWRRRLGAHTVTAIAQLNDGTPTWRRGDLFGVTYEARTASEPQNDDIRTFVEAFADYITAWTARHLALLTTAFANAQPVWEHGARTGEVVPTAALGVEASLLAPLFREIEILYGAPCIVRRISGPVPDAYAIDFPTHLMEGVDAYSYLLGIHGFSYPMRRYLSQLGYGWSDAEVDCVPTPSSFVKLADAMNIPLGFSPQLVPVFGRLNVKPWVGYITRGSYPATVPSHVRPLLAHRNRKRLLLAEKEQRGPLRDFRGPATALVHDMGMHATATHRIPIDCAEQLRAVAKARLSESRKAAQDVAVFFEGTLTRESLDMFRTLDRPEDFADMFRTRFDDFAAELRGH